MRFSNWSQQHELLEGDSRSSGIGPGDLVRLQANEFPDFFELGPIRMPHLSLDDALGILERRLESGTPACVAFCNAHSIGLAHAHPPYQAALATMLVLNDGVALDIASRVVSRKRFPANLNGTDFVPSFLARTTFALRIGLLGATPEVVDLAARNLSERFRAHEIVFVHHGYFQLDQENEIVARIADENLDVLLVGMGNPRQELFMHRNAHVLNCRLVFGVGALFDFLSGNVPRAPLWIRKARLEWLFRLGNEPRRLMGRYTVGAFTFAWAVLRLRTQSAQESH